MRGWLWKALVGLGWVLLVIFSLLVLSFESNPGYGPCPRPPPCSGGSACLISTCPVPYAWAMVITLFGGPVLIALGGFLGYRAHRPHRHQAPASA